MAFYLLSHIYFARKYQNTDENLIKANPFKLNLKLKRSVRNPSHDSKIPYFFFLGAEFHEPTFSMNIKCQNSKFIPDEDAMSRNDRRTTDIEM